MTDDGNDPRPSVLRKRLGAIIAPMRRSWHGSPQGHIQGPPDKVLNLIDVGTDLRVRPGQCLLPSSSLRRCETLALPLDNRLPLLHNSPTTAVQLSGRCLEEITICLVILAIHAAGEQGPQAVRNAAVV